MSIKEILQDYALQELERRIIMVFDGPVTSVGDYCFGDDGLYHEPALHVDFVSLPKTAASIGNGAFKGNTKLLKYPVPVGVLTSIGDDAFNGCSSMAGTNINWLGTNSIYTGMATPEKGILSPVVWFFSKNSIYLFTFE